MSDTIFALSSGHPPSGVAVVRVSGPRSRFACETMCASLPAARRMTLRVLRDSNGDVIDRAMVAWLPGPGSFTGEDIVEFFPHGGPAVVQALLSRLASLSELRGAEPGEFTKRAFLNGKFDLIEAESLADLVGAETEAQRRFALDLARGPQRQLYASWRQRIIHARAMVEADLDFSDEGDVPSAVSDQLLTEVASISAEIATHISGARASEILRDGFRVVIAGPPNAGKSSLLNALANRDAAIVSEVPGTTRDIVEVALSIEGYRVILQDTAGLRSSNDVVERIGIARTHDAAACADLVIMLNPVGTPLTEYVQVQSPILHVASKADLARDASTTRLAISATSGEGLDRLLGEIVDRLHNSVASHSILPARARHVELLTLAQLALHAATIESQVELQSESLRIASDAIGKISGVVTTENLLDVIFRQFCIGK